MMQVIEQPCEKRFQTRDPQDFTVQNFEAPTWSQMHSPSATLDEFRKKRFPMQLLVELSVKMHTMKILQACARVCEGARCRFDIPQYTFAGRLRGTAFDNTEL